MNNRSQVRTKPLVDKTIHGSESVRLVRDGCRKNRAAEHAEQLFGLARKQLS